jgi:hypothetical protein
MNFLILLNSIYQRWLFVKDGCALLNTLGICGCGAHAAVYYNMI